MYAHSQIRLYASRTQMAQLVRGLTWCQRLMQWCGSPPVNLTGDPLHNYDGCWDPSCEQVRRQPSGSAIDRVAGQGSASQRLLVASLLS